MFDGQQGPTITEVLQRLQAAIRSEISGMSDDATGRFFRGAGSNDGSFSSSYPYHDTPFCTSHLFKIFHAAKQNMTPCVGAFGIRWAVIS